MSASDAAASPLLHRVANTQSFQDASHEAEAGSAATSLTTLQTDLRQDRAVGVRPRQGVDQGAPLLLGGLLAVDVEVLAELLGLGGEEPQRS